MVTKSGIFNKGKEGTSHRVATMTDSYADLCLCPKLCYGASVMPVQILSKVIILSLAIWGIYATASALMGVTIYFPLRVGEVEDIPYHRWQAVRVSVFLTFTYFAVLHLVNGSREMLTIKFLETYLVMLTIAGVAIFIREGVDAGEYAIVGFFGVCALILNLASRAKFKRYFSKN